jgi:hypothetical protein
VVVALPGGQPAGQDLFERVDDDPEQPLGGAPVAQREPRDHHVEQQDPEDSGQADRQRQRPTAVLVTQHDLGEFFRDTVDDDHEGVQRGECGEGAQPEEVQAPGALFAAEEPSVAREPGQHRR